MLSKGRLLAAGWVTILIAVLTPVVYAFAIITSFRETQAYPAVTSSLGIIYIVEAALSVFVLLTFRKTLNARANFPRANWVIDTLVATGILNLLFFLAPQALPHNLKLPLAAGEALLLVSFGVLHCVLGSKLLSCEEEFHGYLKAFAYLQMPIGVFYATVCLFPIGVLIDIPALIILAMLFFTCAKDTPPPSDESPYESMDSPDYPQS